MMHASVLLPQYAKLRTPHDRTYTCFIDDQINTFLPAGFKYYTSVHEWPAASSGGAFLIILSTPLTPTCRVEPEIPYHLPACSVRAIAPHLIMPLTSLPRDWFDLSLCARLPIRIAAFRCLRMRHHSGRWLTRMLHARGVKCTAKRFWRSPQICAISNNLKSGRLPRCGVSFSLIPRHALTRPLCRASIICTFKRDFSQCLINNITAMYGLRAAAILCHWCGLSPPPRLPVTVIMHVSSR